MPARRIIECQPTTREAWYRCIQASGRKHKGLTCVVVHGIPMKAVPEDLVDQASYDDADKDAAETARDSIVAKAQRSPEAVTQQTTGRTEDGLPVHSFHSLLADLATLSRNTMVTALAPDRPFTLTTRPTPIQQKALDLLGVALTCTQ